MRMPYKTVEYIALQLRRQELDMRANAPSGPTFFYSYRYNSFLPFSKRNPAFNRALPTSLYYICRYK